MNAIIVDDEAWAVENIERALAERGVNVLSTFTNPEDALNFVIDNISGTNDIGIAFLDINMPGMDGIQLGEKLRVLNSEIRIIYLTAYDDKFKDAYTRVMPDGYLLKPLSESALDMVIRQNSMARELTEKKAVITTFGKFEIKCKTDNRIMDLPLRKKATEVLAVLVDGAGNYIKKDEIMRLIWTDKEVDSALEANFRAVLTQIKRLLREYDVSEILSTRKGECKIDANFVECEYFDVMDGTLNINESSYDNNYLPNYEWAKSRNAQLLRKKLEQSGA